MNRKESQKSRFLTDMIGYVTFRQRSFQSLVEKPSLLKATGLILVIALVAGWASFNYAGKLPLSSLPQQPGGPFPGQGFPVSPEQFRQVWMVLNFMSTVIGIFAVWFISSVLIHVFAVVLGGKGQFKSMLTLAGFASAPLLIQQVLRLGDSFMISPEGVLHTMTSLQMAASPLLNAIANAAASIFTVFGLWSMVLLVIATHEHYRMSKTRSTMVIVLAFIVMVFISALLPFT